jgi:mono/diheme cytochrome c family protein
MMAAGTKVKGSRSPGKACILVVLFVLSSVLGVALLSACNAVTVSEAKVRPPGAVPTPSTGKIIFADYCNSCHPGGKAGAGPALVGRNFTDEQIRASIREGRNRMPAYDLKTITVEELDALVQYIQNDLK